MSFFIILGTCRHSYTGLYDEDMLISDEDFMDMVDNRFSQFSDASMLLQVCMMKK